VAKITDKGKFLYDEEKKRKQAAKHRKEVEIKNIRIGIGTGNHDLELKARQANEFLKEGNKTQIDLRLRGREKYLDRKFLEERIKRLMNLITEPFEPEQVKKGPRGINVIINPKK
jgi:translation initiation factor IF-3